MTNYKLFVIFAIVSTVGIIFLIAEYALMYHTPKSKLSKQEKQMRDDGRNEKSDTSSKYKTETSVRPTNSIIQDAEKSQVPPTISREQHLQKECRKTIPDKYSSRKLRYFVHPLFLYSTKKLMACEVPKSGYMFFKDVFKEFPSNQITRSDAIRNRDKKYRNHTTMIFVRDPFSRLLSAYIDKFFRLHHGWRRRGKRYSSMSQNRTTCGHDITFGEFIKAILMELKDRGTTDVHFLPHSHICSSCEVRYNFIGKLETANSDVSTLLTQHLNITIHEWLNSATQFYKTYKRGVLRRYISRAYFKNPCINTTQTLERVWMALQMQGIISHKIPYPYRDYELGKFNNLYLFHRVALQKHLHQPVTSETKHKIKQVVLRKAFSMVDPEDVKMLRKFFYHDFVLYGYDMYPEFLTDDGPVSVDGWEPFKLRLS